MSDDDLRAVQRRNNLILYYVMAIFAVVCAAHEIANVLP